MTGDAVDTEHPRPEPVAPWIFMALIVPFGPPAFFAIVHLSHRRAGSQAR